MNASIRNKISMYQISVVKMENFACAKIEIKSSEKHIYTILFAFVYFSVLFPKAHQISVDSRKMPFDFSA